MKDTTNVISALEALLEEQRGEVARTEQALSLLNGTKYTARPTNGHDNPPVPRALRTQEQMPGSPPPGERGRVGRGEMMTYITESMMKAGHAVSSTELAMRLPKRLHLKNMPDGYNIVRLSAALSYLRRKGLATIKERKRNPSGMIVNFYLPTQRLVDQYNASPGSNGAEQRIITSNGLTGLDHVLSVLTNAGKPLTAREVFARLPETVLSREKRDRYGVTPVTTILGRLYRTNRVKRELTIQEAGVFGPTNVYCYRPA